MLVSQILKAKGDLVFTVSPQETVGAACALLYSRKVGAMVVLDGERVVGILSERDVVRAMAKEDTAALAKPVSAFMTQDVIFAEPAESVDSLLSRMTDRRVRHLPVCEHERLIGIVSIGDLVKWKISEVEAEADNLKAYIATG
ncbi:MULTISPECIES: CBS domain-containing protein [Phenylobacterium]|uniref:CBS domain-containing protein n=1 Tax=Phenylobacterium koreense TaxID=266125 RepID=A0ABV2EM06_9CAUL